MAGAAFVCVPGWIGVTVTGTVADGPPASVPMVQVTGALGEQDPWLGVADPNTVFAGGVSVTVTPVCADASGLVTCTWKVIGESAVTAVTGSWPICSVGLVTETLEAGLHG